jgi:hypothetical protein
VLAVPPTRLMEEMRRGLRPWALRRRPALAPLPSTSPLPGE